MSGLVGTETDKCDKEHQMIEKFLITRKTVETPELVAEWAYVHEGDRYVLTITKVTETDEIHREGVQIYSNVVQTSWKVEYWDEYLETDKWAYCDEVGQYSTEAGARYAAADWLAMS